MLEQLTLKVVEYEKEIESLKEENNKLRNTNIELNKNNQDMNLLIKQMNIINQNLVTQNKTDSYRMKKEIKENNDETKDIVKFIIQKINKINYKIQNSENLNTNDNINEVNNIDLNDTRFNYLNDSFNLLETQIINKNLKNEGVINELSEKLANLENSRNKEIETNKKELLILKEEIESKNDAIKKINEKLSFFDDCSNNLNNLYETFFNIINKFKININADFQKGRNLNLESNIDELKQVNNEKNYIILNIVNDLLMEFSVNKKSYNDLMQEYNSKSEEINNMKNEMYKINEQINQISIMFNEKISKQNEEFALLKHKYIKLKKKL